LILLNYNPSSRISQETGGIYKSYMKIWKVSDVLCFGSCIFLGEGLT